MMRPKRRSRMTGTIARENRNALVTLMPMT
jgi:hypothetical protein